MTQNYQLLKAVSFSKIIETAGSGPLYLVVDGGEEYYCKKSNFRNVPFEDLLNEIIGHKVLSAWEIPCPIVNFIQVNYTEFQDMIEAKFSDLAQKYKDTTGYVLKPESYSAEKFNSPLFGSQNLKPSLMAKDIEFSTGKSYQLLSEFVNLGDIVKIAFFDLLFENKDRKKSNLNLLISEDSSEKRFIPIDHCQLFMNKRGYNFIDNNTVSLQKADCLLDTELYKSVLEKEGQTHIDALNKNVVDLVTKAIDALEEIEDIIPTEWGYTSEMYSRITKYLSSEKRYTQILEFLKNSLKEDVL